MELSRLAWAEAAACRGSDRALFYPPDHLEGREERLERERTAKAVCRSCDVREACLAAALSYQDSYGIWGGLNEAERRSLRRSVDRPA